MVAGAGRWSAPDRGQGVYRVRGCRPQTPLLGRTLDPRLPSWAGPQTQTPVLLSKNQLYVRLWCGHGVGEPTHAVLRRALCRFSRRGVVQGGAVVPSRMSSHLADCVSVWEAPFFTSTLWRNFDSLRTTTLEFLCRIMCAYVERRRLCTPHFLSVSNLSFSRAGALSGSGW